MSSPVIEATKPTEWRDTIPIIARKRTLFTNEYPVVPVTRGAQGETEGVLVFGFSGSPKAEIDEIELDMSYIPK